MAKNILVVFGILMIAVFFRFFAITQIPPGLYPDEAINGNNALMALRTGSFKVFYPENNGREGLFINIQAIFLNLFKKNEPWVLRFPSALFGVFTVLGIYFLTKELFQNPKSFGNGKLKIGNYEVALLSSFLMATSFWHINFSRIGFRAIMAPFFLVWGIYFLLKTFRQIKEQKSSKFYILNSIFAGIFYGLGFYSYIAYRATPLLIFIILFLYWLKNKELQIRKKILISIFYFLFSTLIVAAPLGLYFLNHPYDFFGRTSQISIFNSPTPLKDLGLNILKTIGMFNVAGDSNWRHNYAAKPELFWPVGILFVIGVILGIAKLLKLTKGGQQFLDNDRKSAVILFAWLIITGLPVVISNEGLPHALRAILMIPPVFIFAAVGGFWLYKFLKTKIQPLILKIFIIIFFIFLIFETYQNYFIAWAKNPNVYDAFNAPYVEIAEKINRLPKELPKYIVVEANGVLVPIKSAFYADKGEMVNIPMPAQTIMFITDTFDFFKQKEKNVFYVLPEKINLIPQNSFVVRLK